MALEASAFRAWDFAQSIGVNTHISWKNPGSAYADFGVIQRSLAYLGATYVRDGIPYGGWTLPEYVSIAATGIKFDILVSGPTIDIAGDLAQIRRLAVAVPGSIAAIEGANEFNTGSYTLNGVSSHGNPAWAKLFGPQLYGAVKADPVLSGVSVVAASMANASAADVEQEGDVSGFADSANWHVYYGGGEQPARNIAYNIAQARRTAPGRPVTITETGYYTAVDAMDWGGGGGSEPVQAIVTVNILLDAFKQGASRTYLYELLDNIARPASNDLENTLGLFLADGTPKPAAMAIHNLTSILADRGAGAATFTPGVLRPTFTGLPTTGSSLVMQKSDGTFDLVVWDEPKVWDQAARSALNPAAKSMTVDLGAAYALVKVYDPLVGTAPVQVLTNTSTVQLALGSHPYVIEVAPLPAPRTFSPGAAGGTVASKGADTVIVGTGAVTVTGDGPTLQVVGGPGALRLSGTAKASVIGGAGAMNLTLSGAGSAVTGGAGGMTVLDLVGGNTIQGASGVGNNGINVTTTRGDSTIVTGLRTATNVIKLGSGNDTVVANGTSTVKGSTGNNAVTVNGWWGDVTTGTGASTVTFNAAGVVTTNGRDVVRAARGLTVEANGPSTSVTGGDGFMWFSGRGGATVAGGSGGGSFDFRRSSGGAITTAAGATNTILLGTEAATVAARGTDTVRMGSGAATVSALCRQHDRPRR